LDLIEGGFYDRLTYDNQNSSISGKIRRFINGHLYKYP